MENQEKSVFVANYEYSQNKNGVVSVTLDYGINDPNESECLPEQRTFFLTEVLKFLKSEGSIVDFDGKMVTIEEEYMGNTYKSDLHYDEVLETEDFTQFLNYKLNLD